LGLWTTCEHNVRPLVFLVVQHPLGIADWSRWGVLAIAAAVMVALLVVAIQPLR
jgi:hypothetical protein